MPWAEQLRVVEAPKNEELTAKHDGSTTKNDVVLTKKSGLMVVELLTMGFSH